jgi:hypothetical protein
MHPGTRVPVDGTDMEAYAIDEEEEDQMITIVKWTCCGETTIDDPGCKEVRKGDHIIDATKMAKAAVTFRTGKIIE